MGRLLFSLYKIETENEKSPFCNARTALENLIYDTILVTQMPFLREKLLWIMNKKAAMFKLNLKIFSIFGTSSRSSDKSSNEIRVT